MTDVVSELSARALDQIIGEGHDIGNDLVPDGGDMAEVARVESAGQALEEVMNDSLVIPTTSESVQPTSQEEPEPSPNENDSPLSESEEAMLQAALEEEHHEIPVNPDVLRPEETTSRFSSAIWYEKIQEQKVILAGCGGIGSYVAFLLARLNIAELILFDPDTVDATNMSGQLYGLRDVGSSKVQCLYNFVSQYAGYHRVISRTSRYNNIGPVRKIMICGFDNMEARKTFYLRWKSYLATLDSDSRKKCLFIDGRLAAEEYQVFAIQGDDERAMKEYEDKWLFSDAEAEETICSYKQTTFMANMIASTMVNIFVNFIANQCEPLFPRDVPFFTSYDASTMFTKIEM